MSEHTFKVTSKGDEVSALFELPESADCALVLAHGAGAGMNHAAMKSLSAALSEKNIAVFRYQFLYMERGSKRVDPKPLATACVKAAVLKARELTTLPIFAGGKSFGGRMTTTAQSLGLIPEVRGLICFGFPLHPAGAPGIERAEHLAQLNAPTLFLQGTRDDLADLSLIKTVVASHSEYLKLHILDQADHGFAVLKSSGRTTKDVLQEVAAVSRAFCDDLLQ